MVNMVLQILPMGATSGPFLFTDFIGFIKYAIKSARPDLFYLSLPSDQIQLQLFRPQADLKE